MQSLRILLVEDQDKASSLPHTLSRHGYDIATVGTGGEALTSNDDADLILLDLELPDMDGLEVCRQIRRLNDTPMIAFTDGGAKLERVLVLQAGSDDCMDKPYEFRELLARIEALMRRLRPRQRTRAVELSLSIGALEIDATAREARLDGRHVELTRKEFELLYYLARNAGTVVTRQRLMAEVWGDQTPHAASVRASRTIDTHVGSLRSKLGGSGWIRTVRGVGFRFACR
nr:response regulator transcription factor [Kibdelosporangium sp. MJ126-NF4]ADB02841.1 AzicR3 [Kibdelosporangium sp. MJ126-NF4]CEL14059.1 Phosphate regulon transcriptional regulatory protein PhoB (SphR) [Kibdelosporangium sp. MJ126-NF4]CTQ88425.1 Phosphate regulon transcriptional regulatory protein PhoB (SphR) [Kibdelosporangium sp. MJ126-NF4]